MSFLELTSIEKPETIPEYKNWLKKNFEITLDAKYEFYYRTVTDKMKADFEKSELWKEIIINLPSFNDAYNIEKGYPLLNPTHKPEIYLKSLDSLIIKSFRKNILNNNLYPNCPKDGWIIPHNWFLQTTDIIRTFFVVKYLDGVEFLLKKLESSVKRYHYAFEYTFEAREEGYYAAHSGIKYIFEIPNESFAPINVTANIEIQITTQLQEVIKSLIHKFYEINRKKNKPKDYKWQWDYKSEEFAPNYLGHILHYLEGMIIEIRDKPKK